MKQSLVEQKNYITQLREENIYQNVQYERVLSEVERDKEAQEAQCLARQFYIQHIIKQIYKAIHKAYDMFEKAKTLYQEVVPIGKNRQRLVNFLEKAKDHYEQVKMFYKCNCNMLNAM